MYKWHKKKAWTDAIYAIFRSFELNINKSNCTFLKCKFSDQTSVPFLHLFTHTRTRFFEVDFNTLCSCTRYFLVSRYCVPNMQIFYTWGVSNRCFMAESNLDTFFGEKQFFDNDIYTFSLSRRQQRERRGIYI